MKNLILVAILCISVKCFAQEINFDPYINYNLWQNNSFSVLDSTLEEVPGYTLTINEKFIVEKSENGKHYLILKKTDISSTTYVSEVIDLNVPDSTVKVGDKIYTELLSSSTESGIVVLKTINKGETNIYAFKKQN